MNSNPDRTVVPGSLAASLAIDNLRVVIVLLVLACHSVLAYMSFLPATPFAFDKPPFFWRSVPIVDSQRWLGFELFSAWLDVFLMSLFFLLSGLFVWQSLKRKGARNFLHDRALRLGLPFAFFTLLLMPLANYPTYLQTAAHPGIADFWHHWRDLPLWPAGPMWFLWLLLLWDIAAAGLFHTLAQRHEAVLRLSSYAREHTARFLSGLLLVSVLAYIPLALLFGPLPWVQRGPFSFQLCRPGLYAVFFFAGVVIGACGIDRSPIAPDGPLARRWAQWLVAAAALFIVWLAAMAKIVADPAAPLAWRIGDDLSFVLACFASCCCSLALAMRFARVRARVLDRLQSNAYGMYLIHYVFVVWLQFALLGFGWHATVKAAIVFTGTLALSWAATVALRRVPAFDAIVGGGRRAPARALSPLRSATLKRSSD